MRLILRILKWSALGVFILFIVLFTLSLFLQDSIANVILQSINRNISTKIVVGSYKISLIRRFPKASLELKNVLVHSSGTVDKDQFKGIHTDTLLAARSVSMEFRMSDIIKEIYNIESLSIKDGELNFFIDSAGFINYEISAHNGNGAGKEFKMNLDRINI
jgi:hypothetical protein